LSTPSGVENVDAGAPWTVTFGRERAAPSAVHVSSSVVSRSVPWSYFTSDHVDDPGVNLAP
jgi:hypothetical protein